MCKEITLAAAVENVEAVTAFVEEILEGADCPMKTVMQIDVAIDEIFSNIAYYSYAPKSGDATVRVEISGSENDQNGKYVVITFIDGGKQYDPLEKTDPDVTLSAEDREIGGLGIFMVKKSMDELKYEYKDGKNHFSIKKYF